MTESHKKKRIRLTWLKVGDKICNGDYCWDRRSNPVKVWATLLEDPIKLTESHHPHFRIITL